MGVAGLSRREAGSAVGQNNVGLILGGLSVFELSLLILPLQLSFGEVDAAGAEVFVDFSEA